MDEKIIDKTATIQGKNRCVLENGLDLGPSLTPRYFYGRKISKNEKIKTNTVEFQQLGPQVIILRSKKM